MANGDDSFSRYMDMLRAFHTHRLAAAREQENQTVPPPPPRETPAVTPPPPRETDLANEKSQSLLNSLRSTSLTSQETETCMRSLTNVMTSSEDDGETLFQEVISNLNRSEFLRMATLLTSISDDHYFLEIARTKNGSIRLQRLLGISHDADTLICAAILRHFCHVMRDEHASQVAIHGMRVVYSHEKKMAMRDQMVDHAVPLACDQYGSIALNTIISDVAFLYCTVPLFDEVASNALLVCSDAYGNVVVQNVLKHCSLHSAFNIAVSLRGHYIELSSTEGGRCVVEKLLEREETGVMVVAELLECEGDELVRLARSVCGHFVVETVLKVTRGDLLKGLVNKLKPFLPLLRSSLQSTTIAEILESVR